MSTKVYNDTTNADSDLKVLWWQSSKKYKMPTIALGPPGTQDLVVYTATQQFHVHRSRLTAASRFFQRQMWTPDGQPASSISLQGVDAMPVRLLIFWVYESLDLTNLALVKLIIDAPDHAEDALVDNLMQVAALAQAYSMPKLLDHAILASARALRALVNPDTASADFIETVVEKAFSDDKDDAPFERLRPALLDCLHGPWLRSHFAHSSFMARTVDETPALAAALARRHFPPPAVPRYAVSSCRNEECVSRGRKWAFGVAPPHALDVSCVHCMFCGSSGDVSVSLREFDCRGGEGGGMPFERLHRLDEGVLVDGRRFCAPGEHCDCQGIGGLLVSLPPIDGVVQLYCVWCGRH